MIPFAPYPKISDSTSAWHEDEARARELDRLTWVATEKLHGANLCVCSDGDHVVVAKRRAVLQPGEEFFGYRRAVGPLLAQIRALVRELDAPWVFIYGELFGGSYPHPAMQPIDGVSPVQTGIHYGPDVRFHAFDVATAHDGIAQLLPFEWALELLKTHDLPTVPVIATGSLNDMLALPVQFPTRVPAQLGLPALEGDNWAEGLVIKPLASAGPVDGSRPLLKRKLPAFSESVYHASSKPTPLAATTDALGRAEAAVIDMVNDNRINSAISKVGRPGEGSGHAAVVAEVMADLRNEMDIEHGELVLAMSREEASLLWSVVGDEVRGVVGDVIDKTARIDPKRFYADLAWAFLRGRLPDAGSGQALIDAAQAAQVRWHKFKRKDGPPRVTQVLSILEGIQPESLLDIGSGRGAFLWPLVARFDELEVTAVDRLAHRVRDIEAVRAGGIGRVRGRNEDVTALPFDDGAFDVVTILEVLEHLENPAAAAAEVLRVASRFVVASVPSHEDDNPEHIQLFSKDSMTAMFEDAGAERVQISYVLNHMIAVVS